MNLNEEISRINKLMDNGILNESGVARALTAMRGIVPSIRTLGFVTAQNPRGQSASPEYNKKANLKLMSVLSNNNYGYQKIKGKYGSVERSFLVRNISKDDLMKLGEKFDQESIIYGERESEGDYTGMTFQMINTVPGETYGNVMGLMKVFVNVKNADDFYTEHKGRKIVIPFFDIMDMVQISTGDAEITQKFHDADWDGGKIRNKQVDIKLTEQDLNLIETYQERALNTVGKDSYNYRGAIKNILRKYNVSL